ncbi:ABC transporter permease [Anaerosporobacter sp.]|uniref:ABC transporter permease n=1 Tax=Anaerosporobacter sp. TaxID=1872529 RepID=UPI00286ECEC8|nr:ABC transporter permease [Anaerosporobacter sp.]
MKKIFQLTLKSAFRDVYLFFWSLIIPIGGTLALSYFISIDNYGSSILTGMTAVSVLFYAFMTTAFAVLSQRRRGVYNLLHITPLPLWKYIVSVSGAWTCISAVSSLIVLIVGIIVLKLDIHFLSIILCLPVIILSALCYIFLSFIVSRFCKNEAHANMLCNFVTLPFMLCSTAFYSLENAPHIIRNLSLINPFEYFITGIRVAITGNTESYIMCFVILSLFLIVMLILATKSFRYSDV